ncbi:ATP/GTP-binding protein [Streptomyces phaeochromogenes]|uniref:ATP/GTP-binding protein n=1 Tax=Streptomyces phaeochromogenes TaxID=1923 RepID=A0ABZ1H6Y0_STRPH|nr:ATP/GTP-binding protein [Streptomyces phaeochromogenes]WRZ28726.1 ATP/GTP-binding protein [Streptomyces phaeochromogenes]WSD14308.1 ATP/GTP-binding protein [Streptomyces phaeochromogenes]WSJ08742.1 ATP/GTP-binding protein [Streptomyces phaeochromogenes]WSW18291.1 ATP/GTP-binding protein [Streptomyces phaeochromogenes]
MPSEQPISQLKVVVAGGFGAGKTTLVARTSEIEPISTDEQLTTAGIGTDSLDGVEAKTSTTVAFDFGRLSLSSQNLALYLFGTPGQARYQFMWNDIVEGAIGAVVLADTRRLEDSFDPINYFLRLELPFIVGLNQFEGSARYPIGHVREALRLDEDIPVIGCDARDPRSGRHVLITLVKHAHAMAVRAHHTRPSPARRPHV